MRKRSLTVAALCTILIAVTALAVAFPVVLYLPLGAVRQEAFFAGRPTSYWARALKGEPFLGEQPYAGDVGKRLRDGAAAAVPVLRELAASSDEELRSEALLALSLMGPEAKGAAPELETTLRTEKNSTRFLLAGEALGNADPPAAATALAAIARAKEEDGGRRAFALAGLSKLAPRGQEAVPALTELLQDPTANPALRVEAARVLWLMKQPAEPLVATLSEILSADKSPAGVQALELLGELGPAAKPAVPVLRKLLDEPSLELLGKKWGAPHRAAVIRTLGQIGPEADAAVPALVAQVRDNYYLRTEVTLALANLGPKATQALAARDAVWATSLTLLAAPPLGPLATPPLAETLRRTWIPRGVRNRDALREAILQIDPTARARVGAL
jgi:HEAT repeat protein